MKLSLWTMSTTLVGLSLASSAFASDAGRLPPSWFVLPEDVAAYNATHRVLDRETRDGVTYKKGEEHVGETVDRIFAYTAESLDRSGTTIGTESGVINWEDFCGES